ncbi:bifunctional [glutamine synthetase] adenylyltransferase/[glutamine synthetase]-adenylyl-L-tyrosine phosphorylase [Neomegalonema sp.]|uniref:bifunctional [glutamine synthetase] adenylyltransferase/[glutamine synthetase]-adenylyl-L-tyrosine phosphorylase n=1 Tax=Neomegalonema sp. TaxID=2039713 RepID=UPI00262C684A|nr:bifunctional [glutamine synthetase] adenylyltransferase/[glutamine synthetase]-adenylyl-L-tyrosine phosphorylase [Neomegalonema sp.]MDD2868117.1 bifunctional [glutamine synthetase] adenylyltransferase/[glutamine synthetase]-adenylyl-L-tyrosine phosphorylase [Neomegalonema sp.]
MTDGRGTSLGERLGPGPVPFSPESGLWAMEALQAEAAEAGTSPEAEGRGAALTALLADSGARAFMEGVAGCSPYLADLLRQEALWLPELFAAPPERTLESLKAGFAAAARSAADRSALMRDLRILKRRTALLTGFADIGAVWPLEEVTGALTEAADGAVKAALDWLFLQEAKRGKLPLDPEDPAATSGFIVLAMGKMGAGELNYSSDIDLILFFDPDRLGEDHHLEAKDRYNRMAKDLVRILSDRTEHGYVFRTDLRLRPDPDATPPCMSTEAAEHYYSSLGRNWERAAYIKARPCAGDLAAGAAFLKEMAPFIWRKTLDFAAIEDVKTMKYLIHAHKGHGSICVFGHDLKLGRGGIREIEFFAQTEQLILGGRDPSLRDPTTRGALAALTAAGWISEEARAQMLEDYRFLRQVEHRIQMVEDAQTHAVPATPEGVARLAAFLRYPGPEAFAGDLRPRLTRVAARFDKLFETDKALEEEAGGLVIALETPDGAPAAAAALKEIGYQEPERSVEILRGWRTGRLRAARTPRSRAKLEKLTPVILRKLAAAPVPDEALAQFDNFLTGLPAGVQIFSLLESNPGLFEVLTQICAAAPRLAAYLGRNSGVLDAMLSPSFFEPPPPREALAAELALRLEAEQGDYERTLDIARVWARERQFQLGVQLVSGLTDAAEAGPAFTDLAELSLRALEPLVNAEFARRHGPPPGRGAAVLAMGKLGAREMTATSDLDMIVVYDADTEDMSTGERPLSAPEYYARWTQKLVSAVTAPTSEGAVYEVDMRLRPSGRAGPLATSLASFRHYQAEEAWTWEHMALTRARIVAGSEAAEASVRAAVKEVLNRPHDRAKVMADARDMRRRVDEANPKDLADPWSLKLTRGGALDLDFIAQTLLLTEGLAGAAAMGTRPALATLKQAGALPEDQAERLTRAFDLEQTLLQIQRVAVEGVFHPETAAAGLKAAMVKAASAPDFEAMQAELFAVQAEVLALWREILGAGAEAEA